MKPWMEGLNPQQAEAVTHGAEPLLILAGAGSGKTRVITSRIAHLVAERDFYPSSVLAVTFTNKAAAEMRERVSAMIPDARSAMIRTFHSFGAWLLRRYAKAAGLSHNFTIYDDTDQAALTGQILPGLPRRELRMWAQRISRAKDEGLGPDDDLSQFSRDPDFPEIYRQYEKRLREIGNVDFGDLILLPVRLLQSHPEIKDRLRFRAVLVDEYQDTNVAQYQLLKELAAPGVWVGVVGDDDQSIYRFRGAEVGNILGFPDMFPGTKVIKLEQNYRSAGNILKIASAVVANNSGRLGKTLWTSAADGDKAVLATVEDQKDEAGWCADRLVKTGNFGGSAVLYRTNAQSRAFETLFRQRGIPCRVVGTLSFYQREEVKDVLAWLSWLANPRDEIAFRRIANKPSRGLGKTSLDRLLQSALSDHSGDILAVCRNSSSLKGKAAQAVKTLCTVCDGAAEDFEHLGAMIRDLSSSSGLLDHYREVDRLENSQRTANLDELVNAASEYPATGEGLAAFLELIELDQAELEEHEDDENCVTLITIHNTKGLEFDNVIITGLEEGLFPRGADDDDEHEEERRLFYVAITRARKQLAFTNCRSRMLWGRWQNCNPSRFLDEIPEELINRTGAAAPVFQGGSWQPGVRLYHDDYGVGVVQKRIANGGHTVLHVLFESGRNATILPEFAEHKMEVLGSGS